MKWDKNWFGTPVKCVFCAFMVEPGEGVILRMGDAKQYHFHERCLRTLAAVATVESVDLMEVGGVWQVPPPITGRSRASRSPYVIYDELATPPPQEPPKYKPTIPPRRKPGT